MGKKKKRIIAFTVTAVIIIILLILLLVLLLPKKHTKHNFVDYVYNYDATCTEDGTKTAKCTGCDKTDTVKAEGSKLPHTFTEVKAEEQYLLSAATCTGRAVYYKSCSVCGAKGKETFESGDALGHSFVNYVSDGNVTCTADGTKTATCEHDGCNETDQKTETKLGHSFVNYVSDGNVTCTADGTKTATCEHDGCNETAQMTEPKLGHSFVNYVSDGNVTCTADGTKTATCEHGCGETAQMTEPKLGHSFVNYVSDGNVTCTADGTKTAHCEHEGCNETAQMTEPATGHSYAEAYSADKTHHWYAATCGCADAPLEKTAHNLNDRYVCTDCKFQWYSDGLVYNNSGNTVYLDYGCAADENGLLVIPGEIDGKKVVIPDMYMIFAGSDVQTLVLGEGIEEIPYEEFAECPDLKSAILPDSLKEIGDGAFSYCTALESITIPNGVTYIGGGAFEGCTSLKSVEIPAGVTDFEPGAFSGCTSLESLTVNPENENYKSVNDCILTKDGETLILGCKNSDIPSTVKIIGDQAFFYADYLETFEVPSGVEYIGYRTFYNCNNLKSVTIPATVKAIGEDAFGVYRGYLQLNRVDIEDLQAWLNIGFANYNSNPLYKGQNLYLNGELVTSVEFPAGTKHIKDYIFYGCSSLQTVIFPQGLKTIGDCAFHSCAALESVTIPDGVTDIGTNAFGYCSGLLSVSVPDTVEEDFHYVFSNCDNLTYYEYGNALYVGNEGNRYAVLVKAKNTAITSCEIHENTKAIHNYAFENCSKLTSITIPDGVKSIGSSAFSKCSGLTSIIIGNGVTSIGSDAFYNCSSLASVTIPNGVTSLNSNTFSSCKAIKELTAPASVMGVFTKTNLEKLTYTDGDYINGSYGSCSNLTQIILPEGLRGIETDLLSNYGSLVCNEYGNALYLGSATNPYLALIKARDTSITSCIVHEDTKIIGYRAFYNCSSLTSVTIPDSVTYIGNYAFNGCDNLQYYEYDNALYLGNDTNNYAALIKAKDTSVTSCTIHENTKVIAGRAFNNCKELTSIAVPDGVKSIGSYAFENCIKLTSVTIGNGVTDIVDHAFRSCGSLTSVTIPDGVTSIGKYAFASCGSLTSVTIPDSVTSIGNYAFDYCRSLTSVTIPDGVTSIGENAFSRCAFTSVIIPDSVTSIGDNAFWACSNLTSLAIGNGVTRLGSNTFSDPFRGCDKLTSVTISEGLDVDLTYVFRYRESIAVYCFGDEGSFWSKCLSFRSSYKLTVYCYSESEPTESGNFWHYVDGVATVWESQAQ